MAPYLIIDELQCDFLDTFTHSDIVDVVKTVVRAVPIELECVKIWFCN